MILEAAMDLASVDVERFELGRFGDLRLQKRGLGAIRFWRRRPGLAFWNWRAASDAAKLDLGGFYAILL